MIELTVALPMWKSKYFGWLPLESFIRQQNIDFDWELIIMEEKEECFGEDSIMEYKDKLFNVRCKEIKYIQIDDWIPLAQKWRNIALEADVNSECFLCHAADNFSQPMRLKESYDAIVKNDMDYIVYPQVYFYSIPTEEIILHSFLKSFKKNEPCKGLHYSYKTVYAKKLPLSDKRKTIDGWTFANIKNISKKINNRYNFSYIVSEHWDKGFNTHGFHSLTLNRYNKSKKQGKIIKNPEKIIKKWPEDVLNRLKSLKGKTRI